MNDEVPIRLRVSSTLQLTNLVFFSLLARELLPYQSNDVAPASANEVLSSLSLIRTLLFFYHEREKKWKATTRQFNIWDSRSSQSRERLHSSKKHVHETTPTRVPPFSRRKPKQFFNRFLISKEGCGHLSHDSPSLAGKSVGNF